MNTINKFFIIFGAFWELIVSIIVYCFYYSSGGTLTVNGEVVTQAEFNSLLWPKILFGIFIAIGLIFEIIGIIGLIKDNKTIKSGKECYGKIIDISDTNSKINGKPIQKAKVRVYVDEIKQNKEASESLELKHFYRIGNYLKVKYYNNDITIIEEVEEKEIPTDIKKLLDKE